MCREVGEKDVEALCSTYEALSKAIRRAAKAALSKDPARVQKYLMSGEHPPSIPPVTHGDCWHGYQHWRRKSVLGYSTLRPILTRAATGSSVLLQTSTSRGGMTPPS